MAITTTLAACSTIPANNGPDGAVDPPSALDDGLRYALSFIAQLRDGAGIPSGAISQFAGTTAPVGWLKANGALVSRTTYAALWTFAQAQGIATEAEWTGGQSGRFAAGDGSTTFRLPDLRGVFARGLDESRGLDASRAWGTYQDQANAPHAHGVNDGGHNHGVNDPSHQHGGSTTGAGDHQHGYTGWSNTGGGAGFGAYSVWNPTGAATNTAGNHAHGIVTDWRGTGIYLSASGAGVSIQSNGTEAHPRNVAYPFFIKY